LFLRQTSNHPNPEIAGANVISDKFFGAEGGRLLCSGPSPYWESCCLPKQKSKRKMRMGKKAESRRTKGKKMEWK
jgi:hypothetical protein